MMGSYRGKGFPIAISFNLHRIGDVLLVYERLLFKDGTFFLKDVAFLFKDGASSP
jgi:hypothetical protein